MSRFTALCLLRASAKAPIWDKARWMLPKTTKCYGHFLEWSFVSTATKQFTHDQSPENIKDFPRLTVGKLNLYTGMPWSQSPLRRDTKRRRRFLTGSLGGAVVSVFQQLADASWWKHQHNKHVSWWRRWCGAYILNQELSFIESNTSLLPASVTVADRHAYMKNWKRIVDWLQLYKLFPLHFCLWNDAESLEKLQLWHLESDHCLLKGNKTNLKKGVV